MRLRLDKLVLSAGLALAMVVTTVPVGAATSTTPASSSEESGLALNGKKVTMSDTTVDDEGAFAEAIKGFVKGGDATVALTGYTGTIKDVPVVTVTENTASSAGETVTNKVTSDGYTLTGVTAKAPSIKIAVTNEYTETFTVSVEAADGERDAVGLKTAAEGATEVANHITTLNTLAGKLVQDKDGLKIESVGEVTATANTTGIEETEKAQSVPVTITKTMTATYTIDSLGASGYTYDFVLTGGANYEYQVYKKTADNNIVNVSTVDSSVVNSSSDVMFTITDLTGEYYVAKKPISTSGSLLFGDDADEADNTTQSLTVSDTLTVELGVAADVSAAQKKTFTDLATANGLKVGAYFDATLVGNDTGNAGKLVEINIVKPSDIEALAGEGKTIKYTVLMQHAGMDPVALETTTGSKYITFSSQYFSTFALAYEIVDAAETTAEDPTQEEQQQEEQQQESATTPEGSNGSGSSSSSSGSSAKTADNSMMPLFMTTLLLALCAGSLAIYKEKKTN